MIEDAHARPVHTVRLPQPSAYSGLGQGAYDLFVTAAIDNVVNVWDLRTRRPAMSFNGHLNRVHPLGMAFSPCMRFLATGSEDKVCYLYDIRTGALCERLAGHTDTVTDVSFNPLHPQLATCSFDRKVLFFADKLT